MGPKSFVKKAKAAANAVRIPWLAATEPTPSSSRSQAGATSKDARPTFNSPSLRSAGTIPHHPSESPPTIRQLPSTRKPPAPSPLHAQRPLPQSAPQRTGPPASKRSRVSPEMVSPRKSPPKVQSPKPTTSVKAPPHQLHTSTTFRAPTTSKPAQGPPSIAEVSSPYFTAATSASHHL